MNDHLPKWRRALTAGLLLGTCLSPCTAWAANFDVTNGNDSGAGSLRQAILDSNAAGGSNTITIAPGTTVTLSQSLPMITASVTVTGNNNTLDANNAGRAFFVQAGTVAISNLTINNAVAQGGAGGTANNQNGGGGGGLGAGAAVFVNSGGNVSLTNVTVGNASAAGGIGGDGGGGSGAGGAGGGGGLGGAGGSTTAHGAGGGGGYAGAGGSAGGNAGAGAGGEFGTGGSTTADGGGGGGGQQGSGGNGGGAKGGGGGGAPTPGQWGAAGSAGGPPQGGNGGGGGGASSGGTGGAGLLSGGGGGGATNGLGGGGGIGGGGGGGSVRIGGSGGDFGGGGGASFANAGQGGFGGGGGGTSTNSGGAIGGQGGFGAGGGGGNIVGAGGSFAGQGGQGAGADGGGGGGAALGGSVFVRDGGSLTINDGAFAGTYGVTGGTTGGTGGATAGQAQGTTLYLNGSGTTTFSGTQTLGGADALAGNGTLGKSGAGILTLNGANTNFTGAISVTGGLINFAASNNLGSGTITLDGGGLQWAPGNTTDISGRLAALGASGGTFDTNGNNVSFATALSGGGLSKTGTGTLTLSAANTYTGATTITTGTLALTGGADISTSSVVIANSTFDISTNGGFTAIRTLAGSGTVQLGGNGLVILNGSTEFAGAINGSGGVEIGGGTQTFSGVNTYTNATQIDPTATLALKGAGSIANSAFVGFSPGGPGQVGTFDISQTTAGASIAGLFDVAAVGVVSLGSKTLTITSGSSFNGVIQDGGIGGGTGGNVTIAPNATQDLGGVNTYTGATTIQANATLNLTGNGSIAASSGLALSGAGATFDISGGNGNQTIKDLSGVAGSRIFLGSNSLTLGTANSTVFSGVISDTGGLTKIGTGTLTLSGNNTYTGPTTVNGGTLSVNGSIVASSGLTVNAGGTIGGNGTLPSITINGGTLAPGNSIGTLTIQGNLVLTSAAAYIVEVSPTQADRTNVTGTATLAGTVQAVFGPGSYIARTYTILSATGGSTGTFSSLTTSGLPAGFTASLSYTATDAILNLTATLAQPSTPSGPSALACSFSGNQCNVAGALNNFFNTGGALPPGFVSIFGLTGANLGNALSQLSGEAATGGQQVAFQMGNQFLGMMLDPFVDGRNGVAGVGGPAIAFAPEREAVPEEIALAYAAVLKAPAVKAASFEQRWSAWGGAYGGSNRTSGDPAVIGSHDLSAHTAGFAGGLDHRLTPNTVVGVALAGGGTNWSLANGLGGGKSDAFQAGVYGVTRSGPAYLAAAFAFTNHWMSTDRFAFAGDHLTASFNAQSLGARLESGYRFATMFGGIAPYAAIQAQSFRTPSYRETDVNGGGFALGYNGRTATDTRSELGARFDRLLALNSYAALALRARLAWAHDWVSDPTLAAVFQALPGASFIVNGAAPAKNSALTSAGAELRLVNGVTLLAKFDGEFASHFSTYAGTGAVRYTW